MSGGRERGVVSWGQKEEVKSKSEMDYSGRGGGWRGGGQKEENAEI
jgi:hypothetical protein